MASNTSQTKASDQVIPKAIEPSQTKAVAQDGCPTPFFTIPPELRNHIHGMVFEFPAGEINLLEADPPSKSILLACRQIHDEATGLYKSAYRSYWTTSHFELHCRSKSLNHTVACSKQDLRAVEHLTALFPCRDTWSASPGAPSGNTPPHRLKGIIAVQRFANGRWSIISVDGETDKHHIRLLEVRSIPCALDGRTHIMPFVVVESKAGDARCAITEHEMNILLGFPLRLRKQPDELYEG
ncbi:hypothetical protein LTR74_012415 [Friedmanniomyces endolithicus]|nr:hypothetical protein LTR74_012415 [Friedmanniomyces endolithicus]